MSVIKDTLDRVEFALTMTFGEWLADLSRAEDGLDCLISQEDKALRLTVAFDADGHLEAHYHLPNDRHLFSNYDIAVDALVAQTMAAFCGAYMEGWDRPLIIEGQDVATMLLDGVPFMRARSTDLDDTKRWNEHSWTVWALHPEEGHEFMLVAQVESAPLAAIVMRYYAEQRAAMCQCGAEHNISLAIPQNMAVVE